MDRAINQANDEARDALEVAKSAIAIIADDMAQNDLVLEAAVAKLEASLNDYQARFKKLGEGVRTAAIMAAKGAGIPISNG